MSGPQLIAAGVAVIILSLAIFVAGAVEAWQAGNEEKT